jgi:hypothetical protein
MTTGTLGRGILLQDGGSVTNNLSGYISAARRNGVYIGGASAGIITNLGTIKGARNGVVLQNGGTVSNGSNSNKTAKIAGGRNGVYIAGFLPSTVSNFGTIDASGGRNGINLYLGGNITNGSSVDTTALITGGNHGVYVGGPSTINNFGTITSGTKAALAFLDGGTVINGSTSDTLAKIASGATTGNRAGIYDLVGQTTIINFGTVISSSGGAVDLYKGGGVITNGSTGDKSALLQGSTGGSAVYIGGSSASVTNFGLINGGGAIHANGFITVTNLGRITAGAFSAVGLNNGGDVINGSTSNITASLIGAPGTSGNGIFLAAGPLSATNYGTISGGSSSSTNSSPVFEAAWVRLRDEQARGVHMDPDGCVTKAASALFDLQRAGEGYRKVRLDTDPREEGVIAQALHAQHGPGITGIVMKALKSARDDRRIVKSRRRLEAKQQFDPLVRRERTAGSFVGEWSGGRVCRGGVCDRVGGRVSPGRTTGRFACPSGG